MGENVHLGNSAENVSLPCKFHLNPRKIQHSWENAAEKNIDVHPPFWYHGWFTYQECIQDVTLNLMPQSTFTIYTINHFQYSKILWDEAIKSLSLLFLSIHHY